MPVVATERTAQNALTLHVNGRETVLRTKLPLYDHRSSDIRDCLEELIKRVGVDCLASALNFIGEKAAHLSLLFKQPAPEELVFYGGGLHFWPLEQRTLEVAVVHPNSCSGFAEIDYREGALLVTYVSTQTDPRDKWSLLHKTEKFRPESNRCLLLPSTRRF